MSEMTKDEIMEIVDRINFMREKPKEFKKRPWNPWKATCDKCGWIFWSKWPGQFATCVCDDYCYVDQTRYYARSGGKAKEFVQGICVWYWPARNTFLIADKFGYRYAEKNKRMYSTGKMVPSTAQLWSQL